MMPFGKRLWNQGISSKMFLFFFLRWLDKEKDSFLTKRRLRKETRSRSDPDVSSIRICACLHICTRLQLDQNVINIPLENIYRLIIKLLPTLIKASMRAHIYFIRMKLTTFQYIEITPWLISGMDTNASYTDQNTGGSAYNIPNYYIIRIGLPIRTVTILAVDPESVQLS